VDSSTAPLQRSRLFAFVRRKTNLHSTHVYLWLWVVRGRARHSLVTANFVGIFVGIGGHNRNDTNMLNDTRVRRAKPSERAIKISDRGGLYLLVQPHGSKLWRFAYRFDGKQKTLALGAYPTVTLKQALRNQTTTRLKCRSLDTASHRKVDCYDRRYLSGCCR
jgi:Arm DNA-binding domain